MKYAEAWNVLKNTLEMYVSVGASITTKETLELMDSMEDKYE